MRNNLIKYSYKSLIICLLQIFPSITLAILSFNFQKLSQFALIFIDCVYYILMIYFESTFINWASSKNNKPSKKEMKRGCMIKKETIACNIIFAILRVLIFAIIITISNGELTNVCLGYNCINTVTAQLVLCIVIPILFIISLYNDFGCLDIISPLQQQRKKK